MHLSIFAGSPFYAAHKARLDAAGLAPRPLPGRKPAGHNGRLHLHLDPDVAGGALSPGEVCSNATDLLQAAHWDPLKDAFACRALALRVPAGPITNTECREPDPRTDSMLVKKLPHPSSEG